MILKGKKKKVLKEVVRYYVESTGNAYEDFISTVQKGKDVVIKDYATWLALKGFEILEDIGVTVEDCVENKDVIHSAIKADKSRQEGEFYTPEIWCKEGRNYLKDILGDLWGTAYVWDASCYTMDTEVLTHRGWMTYDNLRDDDYVYALNPDTLQGEYVRFYNRFKKYVKEDLVHFSGKVVDLMVTKDHSMFAKNRDRNGKKASYSFMSAMDMYNHLSKSPSGGNQLRIPSAARLDKVDMKEGYSLKEANYWKLIGFYIGDGYLWKNNNKEYNAVSFKLHKDRKIEYLKNLLSDLNIDYLTYDYRDKGNGLLFRLKNDELLTYISNNVGNGFNKKRIPFKDIRAMYYEDILDGLLNSDGDMSRNSMMYYTANKHLADDVENLMHMLGYSVHTLVRDRVLTHRDTTTIYEVYASKRVQHNLKIQNVALVPYEGYVWDITLDKYHVFKVRRNGKSAFSGNCGSGNLMRTSNYPQDKLFLSTLLDEDVPIVKGAYPDAEVFACDFLNDIDWDENNTFFSDKLPRRLVEVLKNNEPLIFYMNPPYKVMEATKTDVGTYMKDRGLGKCALDIFHQFMYRIVMLKRFYNHTNIHAGIFGPVTMYHSEMVEPLYNEFRNEFDFTGGMCFTAGDFSNTSESVDWIVSYTCWSSHNRGILNPTPMKLDAKVIDRSGDEDTIKTVGSRTIQNVKENIHNWVKAEDIFNYEYLPEVTSVTGFTGNLAKYPTNALACIMSSNYVIRATRRACVTSLPNTDNVPVTEDNFWRAVASYGARRCYATSQNPFNNCQYLSSPNEKMEGYEQWLIDCVTLFLFDYSALLCSYRGVEINGETFNINNKLFPLSIEEVLCLTTDEKIIDDAKKYFYDNSFILDIIDKIKDKFSPKAKELYNFCIGLIKESLRGTYRKDEGYPVYTESWDSGFAQIKELKTLFTDEVEKEYTRLLNNVRVELLYGVYKYGIMEDALVKE